MFLMKTPFGSGNFPGGMDGEIRTGWRHYLNAPMFIMIGVFALILMITAAAFFINMYFKYAGQTPPPTTVSTTHAANYSWQPQIRAVATLRAAEGADLAAEVAGLVTRISFQPGQDVKAGDLLIRLRDDSDRAQLSVFRAQAELARRTFDRYQSLAAENAISKSDFDQAQATLNAANAQVVQQQALVEKKAIRAPYDGRVGIRQVDVGQYINAGQTLVTLQHVDPMFADFLVPQTQISAVKPGSSITLTTDALPGRAFSGTVAALDPKVDPATRNVRVRASVPNPDRSLLPGMFGEVIVASGAPRQVLAVPQTAVVYSPYGDTVYLAVPGKDLQGQPATVARQRFITLGETRGDLVEIADGVTADDEVITSGQMKLKNEVPIVINNDNPLPAEVAPQVKDK